VIIAHRFAYAFAYRVSVLDGVRVLGHRCRTLNRCVKGLHPGHLVASSATLNRGMALRRNPFADQRGPRQRAQVLRDLARHDPAEVTADLDRIRRQTGEQSGLW
jgi:hypothetical protein